MFKKSLIMLKKCTYMYNSQYSAHYAQVEPTIILTKIDMRHEETQLPVTLKNYAGIVYLHITLPMGGMGPYYTAYTRKYFMICLTQRRMNHTQIQRSV